MAWPHRYIAETDMTHVAILSGDTADERGIDPMLFQCWTMVHDAGATLKHKSQLKTSVVCIITL